MNDLFSSEKLFDENIEQEIEIDFPIYVRNNSSTRFTWYKNEQQFEEITINADGESFRGCLMFGFNETMHAFKDKKLFIDTLFRVHVAIEQSEYDAIFEKLINGRTDFFDDAIESQYIERELSERQKNVKHKWKKADF